MSALLSGSGQRGVLPKILIRGGPAYFFNKPGVLIPEAS
jgi:hypothetical protein